MDCFVWNSILIIFLLLSLYIPLAHPAGFFLLFFFPVISSLAASCPKSRSFILVWADAVCLFCGCRKSISLKQQVAGLAHSLVKGFWISLPTCLDYSFIKALVLGKGQYQLYEALLLKLGREYELHTWPLVSIYERDSGHFQVCWSFFSFPMVTLWDRTSGNS